MTGSDRRRHGPNGCHTATLLARGSTYQAAASLHLGGPLLVRRKRTDNHSCSRMQKTMFRLVGVPHTSSSGAGLIGTCPEMQCKLRGNRENSGGPPENSPLQARAGHVCLLLHSSSALHSVVGVEFCKTEQPATRASGHCNKGLSREAKGRSTSASPNQNTHRLVECAQGGRHQFTASSFSSSLRSLYSRSLGATFSYSGTSRRESSASPPT